MRSRRAGFCAACLAASLLITMIAGPAIQAADGDRTIQITAKKFEYSPREITVKRGVPVVLEFTSEDVLHGFNCSDLNIRSDIMPGKITSISFTPNKAGIFPFHCDNFCGSGHETMTGTIKVIE